MDKETLFLRTLEEVSNRLNLLDEYEVLMISGLLRKLLLDDYPLVHQINEKYKIKLLFEITEFSPIMIPSLEFWSIQDGIDPKTSLRPGRNVRQINLKEFLNTIVLRIGGKDFSVKNIIQYEANVTGGVHPGSPKTDKERALSQINQIYSIGGFPAGIRQLKAITKVVIKALEPLKSEVLKSR